MLFFLQNRPFRLYKAQFYEGVYIHLMGNWAKTVTQHLVMEIIEKWQLIYWYSSYDQIH